MVTLEDGLANELRQSKVRIDELDADTVCLRDVPANARFFNKPRTNVLIKRPRHGLPFVVCVDDDLEYTGTDTDLARAFAGAGRERGWRILSITLAASRDVRTVIEDALRAIGFGGREPTVGSAGSPAHVDRRVLDSFGTNVSQLVVDGTADPSAGRKAEIEDAIFCLAQRYLRLPLVVAESGVGKTNFIHGVARGLLDFPRSRWDVMVVDLGALFSGVLFPSERETVFAELLEEVSASSGTVLALEHLELALLEAPHGPYLLAQALDRGSRLIGTILPGYLQAWTIAPLARRVHVIELPLPHPEDAGEMVKAHLDRVASRHGVVIADALVNVTIARAQSIAGPLPATAIALLDAAALRAAVGGEREVGLHHIYLAASRLPEAAES